MKKTFVFLMSVFCFSIILSGCNFKNLAVPEEVKIKTNEKAVYEFPILSFNSETNEKLDMSKYFDLEKLMKGEDENGNTQESSGTGFNIYKYWDGKSNYQQYLLHMPLKEFDFDFGSSFGNMDFSTAIQGFNIDKEFEIPDVGGLDESQKIDLSSIETTLNTAVTFFGMTSPTNLNVTFAGGAFESVEYTSGKFVIDTNYSMFNQGGGNVSGSVTLIDKYGNESSADFNNNIAEIDISGMELTVDGMKLRYTGWDYGTTFVARIKEDSKIKIAKGVTLDLDNAILFPGYTKPHAEVTFPLSLGENLSKVTINEGSLTVELSTPDTWSAGIIDNYTIDISGGLELDPITKANPTVNLQNTELQSADINASATVDIVLDDATIDFEDPPEVRVQTQITKISAAIKMDDSFETSISQNTPVPAELTDYVTSISWNKVGFIVKATNNLPAGNNISLDISSNFLGISPGNVQTIEAGKKDEEGNYVEQELTFVNDTPFTTAFTGANAVTSMDVTGDITLNTDANGNLLVNNVEPAKKYSISLKIDPVFEWEEAAIKMPENVSNFEGNFNTGINKKKMFDSLGDDFASKLNSIKFSAMPLYLFASLPDLDIFENAGFSGVIKAYYGKEVENAQGNKEINQITADKDAAYIFGSYNTEQNKVEPGVIDLSGMAKMPELSKNDKGEVITSFEQSDMDFAKALNLASGGDDTTLCVSYNVGLADTVAGSMTVTSADLEELKTAGKCSISMDFAIILTLQFTLDEPISLDLMEMMKSEDDSQNQSGSSSGSATASDKDKDLLGRSEPTNMEDYEKFLKLVDYAKIMIEEPQLPISGSLNLKVKMYDDENAEIIQLGNGKAAEVKVNPTKLLRQYPLEPKIELAIGEYDASGNAIGGTDFGLLRNSAVKGRLKLQVKASGEEIPIYPFENKDGGSN